jgi:hypothetical protein
MAFLTLAGADYWVLDGGADESDPDVGGESRRAVDGTQRTGKRWYARTFRFVLMPLAPAAFETLQSAIRASTLMAVTGDAVPNGDYEVTLTSGSFIRKGDASFERGPTIVLRQAVPG